MSISKPTPTGITSLQDASLNSMNLEVVNLMDTDFDFDVDMMMRSDTFAEQQQQPQHQSILPPTLQVDAPTKPPLSTVGQIAEIWDRVMSTTSELQSIIGSAVSERSRSSSSGTPCSCPNLIGRLQLFVSHPRLAPHVGTTKNRPGRTSRSGLPLDLLVFLDEVIYQTISSVLSCGVCSRELRVLFTLYLHVDWLADVLKATLETDLLDFSSLQQELEGVKKTHPGAHFENMTSSEKDVSLASKADGRKQDLGGDDGMGRSWEHATNRLHLGSFRLEGELWQICIRDLLKTRLNRLSCTAERIRGSMDNGNNHRGAGYIRNGVASSSLDMLLVSMTTDVLSKIELLFGMMELWEARK
ncbi:hypothetical protein LX36DRAFT_710886 [Colletotrichum falcatum]|nr:hypothetical protein LX36DRAFT_710886 [Colletotrichum falcatum]